MGNALLARLGLRPRRLPAVDQQMPPEGRKQLASGRMGSIFRAASINARKSGRKRPQTPRQILKEGGAGTSPAADQKLLPEVGVHRFPEDGAATIRANWMDDGRRKDLAGDNFEEQQQVREMFVVCLGRIEAIC